MSNIIKNFDSLSITSLRKKALTIIEAGLNSINTNFIIHQDIKLEGNILSIKDKSFDLEKFEKVFIFAFGKNSLDALKSLDQILGDKITLGIGIDTKTEDLKNQKIKVYQGTHPKPSQPNFEATQKILETAKTLTEKDLVICVVSGGGSALLCTDQTECDWSIKIYDIFLPTGGNINELNTLRKHASKVKGGNLAKILSPATIVSLIFSDVPGGQLEDVASGPTYKANSSLQDVQNIIAKYNLKFPPEITFSETPKEEGIFNKVTNILLVSNHTALVAMQNKAEELGFKTEIYSETTTEKIPDLAKKLNQNLTSNTARLCAGEPGIVTYQQELGKGGRNQQLTIESLPYITNNQIFISIASDGVDNSDVAGAIADTQVLEKSQELNLNVEDFKNHLNSYEFFKQVDANIITGPTGSNVADLMLALYE